MQTNNFLPVVCTIKDVIVQTNDIKTFRIVDSNGKKPFDFMPGQCTMISVPPYGEAMISITSSPTQNAYIELSVKNVGKLTNVLHNLEQGNQVLLRGPLGKPFPVDSDFVNKHIVIIGGGIGIAPVRSVINYILDNRNYYKSLSIVYGVKNEDNFVYGDEINGLWKNSPDTSVYLTVDSAINKDNWSGNIGFVPDYIAKLRFNPDAIAVLCGPPIMIKLTLKKLLDMGFEKKNIYTTLEMRMKCGIGKCGRCNIGDKYVCKDGPVFRMDELENLPDEY